MAVQRNSATTGEAVQLRARFTADGAVFDPFEIRKVEILNADSGEILSTASGAQIVRLGMGEYQITVGPYDAPINLIDRWYATGFEGGTETILAFRCVVTTWSAGDLPITRDYLTQNYLFGIDLTDPFSGAPYPDSMFDLAIRAAFAHVEAECRITILPVDVLAPRDERHDYNARDYAQFATLQLDRRPIREVVSLKAYYPGNATPLISFPRDWINLTLPEHGRLEVVPAAGSIASYVIGQGGSYLPVVYQRDFFPGLFRVEYRAGWEPGSIPPNILYLVGLVASRQFLNVAGDLVAGAGLQSKSLSIGGLSQSLATTNSSTNAGYGARLLLWNKEIKEYMAAIRAEYHPPGFVVA